MCNIAKLKQDYRVAKKLGLGKVRYGLCFCHTKNPEQRRAQHFLSLIKQHLKVKKTVLKFRVNFLLCPERQTIKLNARSLLQENKFGKKLVVKLFLILMRLN